MSLNANFFRIRITSKNKVLKIWDFGDFLATARVTTKICEYESKRGAIDVSVLFCCGSHSETLLKSIKMSIIDTHELDIIRNEELTRPCH